MTTVETQGSPNACMAIDLPSPVPAACWRALRSWLEDLGVDFEPTLTQEGLLGYSVRLRNALLGVGLGLRATGPVLSVSAVLCRGMDREQHALAAADRANGRLTLGQILYFPGPPAELSFFTSVPFDLLDCQSFALLFQSVLHELDNVGFPAVMQVRGYHPTDHAAPWGDPMLAPLDDDESDGPADADHDDTASYASQGTADAPEAEPAEGAASPAEGPDASVAEALHPRAADSVPGPAAHPATTASTRRRRRGQG